MKKANNSNEDPAVGIPVMKQYTDIANSATVIDAEYIRKTGVILYINLVVGDDITFLLPDISIGA